MATTKNKGGGIQISGNWTWSEAGRWFGNISRVFTPTGLLLLMLGYNPLAKDKLSEPEPAPPVEGKVIAIDVEAIRKNTKSVEKLTEEVKLLMKQYRDVSGALIEIQSVIIKRNASNNKHRR